MPSPPPPSYTSAKEDRYRRYSIVRRIYYSGMPLNFLDEIPLHKKIVFTCPYNLEVIPLSLLSSLKSMNIDVLLSETETFKPCSMLAY